MSRRGYLEDTGSDIKFVQGNLSNFEITNIKEDDQTISKLQESIPIDEQIVLQNHIAYP